VEKPPSWRDLQKWQQSAASASRLVAWVKQYAWWLLGVFVVLAVGSVFIGSWPLTIVFLALAVIVAVIAGLYGIVWVGLGL
jgi:hypothetical protein